MKFYYDGEFWILIFFFCVISVCRSDFWTTEQRMLLRLKNNIDNLHSIIFAILHIFIVGVILYEFTDLIDSDSETYTLPKSFTFTSYRV